MPVAQPRPFPPLVFVLLPPCMGLRPVPLGPAGGAASTLPGATGWGLLPFAVLCSLFLLTLLPSLCPAQQLTGCSPPSASSPPHRLPTTSPPRPTPGGRGRQPAVSVSPPSQSWCMERGHGVVSARTGGTTWPNGCHCWARGSLHPHPTPPSPSSPPCAVAASAPCSQACPRPSSPGEAPQAGAASRPPPLPPGDTSPPLAAPSSPSASSNKLPLLWIQLSQSRAPPLHPERLTHPQPPPEPSHEQLFRP